MDDLQFAIDARVRGGVVVAGFEGGGADVGVVHAERGEDVLRDVVVPGGSGDGGNDLAGRHVEQVVVGVVAAKTGGGLHEAKLVDDFFARVGGLRPEEEIA